MFIDLVPTVLMKVLISIKENLPKLCKPVTLSKEEGSDCRGERPSILHEQDINNGNLFEKRKSVDDRQSLFGIIEILIFFFQIKELLAVPKVYKNKVDVMLEAISDILTFS